MLTNEQARRIERARADALAVFEDIEQREPHGDDTNDLACVCAALRDILGRRHLKLTGEMLLI